MAGQKPARILQWFSKGWITRGVFHPSNHSWRDTWGLLLSIQSVFQLVSGISRKWIFYIIFSDVSHFHRLIVFNFANVFLMSIRDPFFYWVSNNRLGYYFRFKRTNKMLRPKSFKLINCFIKFWRRSWFKIKDVHIGKICQNNVSVNKKNNI